LSIAFVKTELNEADRKGARELLRVMGNKDILDFLGKKPKPAKVQTFLQLIYTFNRIAWGIRSEFLSKRAIFGMWLPLWFCENWRKLKPLIERERKRRKIYGDKLYGHFEWLAEKLGL
jgi:hypothetical protein